MNTSPSCPNSGQRCERLGPQPCRCWMKATAHDMHAQA